MYGQGGDLFQEAARAGALHCGGVEKRADVCRGRSGRAQHAAASRRLSVPRQELQHQLWGDALVWALHPSHTLSLMGIHMLRLVYEAHAKYCSTNSGVMPCPEPTPKPNPQLP